MRRASAWENSMPEIPADLPIELQHAIAGGLLERLPLTFLPFVQQQLR